MEEECMEKRNILRWPVLAGSLLAQVFAGNAWAAISVSSASWSNSGHTLTVSGSVAASRAALTANYTGGLVVIGTTIAFPRTSANPSATSRTTSTGSPQRESR
jgi:hypothetical protein